MNLHGECETLRKMSTCNSVGPKNFGLVYMRSAFEASNESNVTALVFSHFDHFHLHLPFNICTQCAASQAETWRLWIINAIANPYARCYQIDALMRCPLKHGWFAGFSTIYNWFLVSICIIFYIFASIPYHKVISKRQPQPVQKRNPPKWCMFVYPTNLQMVFVLSPFFRQQCKLQL